MTIERATPAASVSATAATTPAASEAPRAASEAPPEMEAMSSPGQSRVELATRSLAAAMRPCRDRALKADPKLDAKAKLEIEVQDDGTVDRASFVSPDTLTASTQACVVAAVRGLALPPLGRRTFQVWIQLSR